MLKGIRVLEIEGQGPAPFCAMLLADLGADVILINRAVPRDAPGLDDNSLINRGKRSIALDLKAPSDVETFLKLSDRSDVVIEGFRPGVVEKLGIGPDVCRARNPKLVFARMTGWGQTGSMAQEAGHDLNYLALSGALWYAGAPGQMPVTPPTMQGDVPGGLYLMIGILAALLRAKETGLGDTIDAAIFDASAHMQNLLLALRQSRALKIERGKSLLDGPHWSRSYKCSDGRWLSVQCLEPKFYDNFLRCLGLQDNALLAEQFDSEKWPAQCKFLEELFASRDGASWLQAFAGADACVAPVLNIEEAAAHQHNDVRNAFVWSDGVLQGAPAPRFESITNWSPKHSPTRDEHRAEILNLIR